MNSGKEKPVNPKQQSIWTSHAAGVAVITPRFRDYLDFIETLEKIDTEKYVWVYDINRVRGRMFTDVKKLRNWRATTDIDDIMEYIEKHTIKK